MLDQIRGSVDRPTQLVSDQSDTNTVAFSIEKLQMNCKTTVSCNAFQNRRASTGDPRVARRLWASSPSMAIRSYLSQIQHCYIASDRWPRISPLYIHIVFLRVSLLLYCNCTLVITIKRSAFPIFGTLLDLRFSELRVYQN